MNYEVKNFSNLIGLPGFSDQLLENHFKLYEGYVANTNKVMQKLAEFAQANQTDVPEFAELNRRFGWEFNGMRLHELYFSNLTKESKELDMSVGFGKHVSETFGDIDKFTDYLKTVGALRGIGWVVVSWDQVKDCAYTTWINEHDVGHLAGATPLLVMDVFEHAYLTDYGLKRADYIDAFMKAVDWEEVNRRFEAVK